MKNIETKHVRKRLREYAEKSISNTNNKEILKRLLKYQSKLKSKIHS